MEDILNSLILLVNFIVIPGFVYGCQLAMGALGITLIYGVLRFAHFPHGEVMGLGTGIVVLSTYFLQAQGVSLGVLPTALLALPIGILGTIAYVLLIDRCVYRYYRVKKASTTTFLIVAIGVMFMSNGLVRFFIGPNDRNFQDGERFIIHANEFKEIFGLSEGISFKTSQGLTMIISLISVSLLFWFLTYTRSGKSMRAYADNEDLALLSGINPERVVLISWVIVACLATIGGTLYGLDKSYLPYSFYQILLPLFAVAIVGGLGNPVGALVGGFLVSYSEIIITSAYKKFFNYLLPESLELSGLAQFLGTEYKLAVSVGILVLVLIFKPQGIFKGRLV